MGGFSEVAIPGGIAPGAGGRLPGPIGAVTPPVATAGREQQSAAQPIDVTFTVAPDTYRLRRPGAVWNSKFHEEPVGIADARAILARAMKDRGDDTAFVRLLEISIPRLGLIDENALVLMRLHRPRARWSASAPAYAPPPPKPQPVPSSAPPPEPVMSPEIAAAQVAALKQASASGVPFCEECARAAAQEAAMAGA